MSSENNPMGLDAAVDALLTPAEDTDEAKAEGTTAEEAIDNTDDVDTDEEETEEVEDDSETDEEDAPDVDNGEDKPESKEEKDPGKDKQADTDPNTVVFSIDDDGEEVSITASEAKKGFMLQKDYTKGKQALAEERKSVETDKQESTKLKMELAQSLEQVKMLANQELAEFVGVDWEALERDDPIEFEEKARKAQVAQLKLQQGQQAQGQLVQQIQAEEAERLTQLKADESRKLALEMPELFEGETLKDDFKKDMLQFGTDVLGFTEEELVGLFDHRQIKALQMAMEGHKISTKRKTVAQKKAKKSTTKTVKQGATKSQADRKSDARQKRMKRVRTERSVDSAVDALFGKGI